MGEEVFSFKLSLFTGAAEGDGYSDVSKVDGKVTMRLGCIQIVYLHKFLMSLLVRYYTHTYLNMYTNTHMYINTHLHVYVYIHSTFTSMIKPYVHIHKHSSCAVSNCRSLFSVASVCFSQYIFISKYYLYCSLYHVVCLIKSLKLWLRVLSKHSKHSHFTCPSPFY